jgi:hypothetical protein
MIPVERPGEFAHALESFLAKHYPSDADGG